MLYLARHGETDWNREGRWQGQSDVGLNEDGVKQALEASSFFLNIKLDAVYSSDLRRAVETTSILTGKHKNEMLLDSRLRERSFGPLEGKTTAEIQVILGREISIQQIVSEEIPLSGIETVQSLFARAEDFLGDLTGKEKLNKLVVSHGVFIGILLQLTTGIDFRTRKVGNCEIITIKNF